MASCANAFTQPSSPSLSLPRTLTTTSLYSAPISTSQDTSITSEDDDDNDDEITHQNDKDKNKDNDDDDEWWKTYKFQHDDVANEIRDEFPILKEIVHGDKELIYLDSAATSQKPNYVISKLKEYYEKYNSNVHRGAHSLSQKATSEYENARDIITNFINAKSRNEVIFTSGATEAINLISQSYGRSFLKEDDEVICSVMEHHSNIIPWQLLHNQIGCTVKYIQLNEAQEELDFDDMIENLITEKTKIITFQHVSNTMGCINDVKEIVKRIRSINPKIIIIIDACQSVPHMKVDVQDMDVDFLVASGHKMCGPTGIGFLWGREELLNEMPPFLGGGEMIDYVSLDPSKTTYAKAPARFEAGTPQIGQAIGLGYAISYLEKIGMERIFAYEHELSLYLYKRLNDLPEVTILGPPVNDDGTNRASLCCFTVEGIHPSDLSTFLDLEGVAIRSGHHCCQPLHQALNISHSSRASLYFYNTQDDVDIFINKLKSTIQFFNNMNTSSGSNSDDDSSNDDDDDDDEETFVPFI